jgi:hypothetical protein
MPPANSTLMDLERDAYRIVGMICSETVPEDEVRAAIERLRGRAAQVFPEDPRVFDRVYGRRFARLRTRFRPAPGLFAPTTT